jgi:hypothetical protein
MSGPPEATALTDMAVQRVTGVCVRFGRTNIVRFSTGGPSIEAIQGTLPPNRSPLVPARCIC